MPDGTDCDHDGKPDEYCTTYEQPASRADYHAYGLSSHYFGLHYRDFTNYESVGPPQRWTWNANGEASSSCEEYIYESYFDYAVWEDWVASRAPDYRAIAAEALDPSSSISPLNLPVLVQRDGQTAIPDQLQARPAYNLTKNVYFSVPLYTSIDASTLSDLERYEGISTDEPTLAAIVAKVQAGRQYRAPHGWAWHRQQWQALRSVSPDLLDANEELREQFVTAVRDQALVREELFLAYTENANVQPDEIMVPEIWDPTIYEQDLISRTVYQQWDINTPDLAPIMAPGTFAMQTAPTQWVLAKVEPPKNYQVDVSVAFTKIQELQERLKAARSKILALLREADRRGCLEFDPQHPDQPNACDWSPKMFWEDMSYTVMTHREPEFKRCQKLAGDFSSVRSSPVWRDRHQQVLKHWKYGNCDRPNYTGSPDDVRHFLWCKETAGREAYMALMELGDHASKDGNGRLTVSDHVHDDYDVGNKNFGAKLTYDLRWSIAKVNAKQQDTNGNEIPNPCEIETEIHGLATVVGKAFGAEKELLNASADVYPYSSPIDTHVNVVVLGYQYYDKDIDLHDGAGVPVSIVDEYEKITPDHDYTKNSFPFTIGFIPFVVEGGISGQVGVQYDMAVGLEYAKNNTPYDCESGQFYLSTNVAPVASVKAYGAIAMGWDVAKLGVRTDLTIASVKLPFRGRLTLDSSTGDYSDLVLRVNNTADLDLTLLAGKVSAFAEIDFWFVEERVSATIFKWDGISYHNNLFAAAANLPISALPSNL